MSTISSATTRMRLTGLSSGMDTDTIIQNLMSLEKLKLNRHLRKVTTNEWKQDALNSIASDIKTFQNTFITALGSSAKAMQTESAYKTYDATVSGEYKDAVSIRATSSASTGRITINSISQLATSAGAKSTDKVSKDGTDYLSEGNYISLEDLNKTLKNELEFDDNGNVSFNISYMAKDGTTGEMVEKTETFTFNKTDRLQDVMTAVNNSDAGVTLSYSRLTDKFTLETKETGTDSWFKLENAGDGNMFGEDGAFGIETGVYDNGQNAKLRINDTDVERSSNTFSIDGIQYTLNDTTPEEVGNSANIRINVTQNVDTAVDNIKNFVEGYNSLLSKLDAMLSEKKTTSEKSYEPLTDDEKALMTEAQIETWEAIAKKGLLYNDSGLRSMVDSMRSALYETVSGAGLSMADIGLGVNNYFLGGKELKGQISLDEEKLRAALQKDPDQVMRVFVNFSESEDTSTYYKESGFTNRINDIMNNYVKNTQYSQLQMIDRDLVQLSDKITRQEDLMTRKEEALYAKYAAMETALSKMQSQTDWISSMLGTSSS